VSWALGHRRDDGISGSGRTTTMQARGRHESTVSRAWERHRGHNVVGSGRMTLLRNNIVGLGTVPAWSTASPTQVGEDGCA
jgi:hypothetical protein